MPNYIILAIIITAGIVAWKLIEAMFEFAETWAVTKYTGKAPHGWEGTKEDSEEGLATIDYEKLTKDAS